MEIKRFNICSPETYVNKDKEEKTMWHRVGRMTEFIKENGAVNRMIEIPAIGLKAQVFPEKEREDRKPSEKKVSEEKGEEQTEELGSLEEDIRPEDLPFN